MFRKAVTEAGPRAGSLPGRLLDAATLKLHALAVRLDEVPPEFGDAIPVDQTDPRALRREWLRQARLWATYNPEDVFALKAGALVGGAALLGVVAMVAAA